MAVTVARATVATVRGALGRREAGWGGVRGVAVCAAAEAAVALVRQHAPTRASAVWRCAWRGAALRRRF